MAAEPKKRKNKLSTPGYFIKRLKDSGFVVLRIYQKFSMVDPRRWIIMVDPGNSSLLITCYENKEHKGDILFEMNDGGRIYPKNFSIRTDSIEVIISNMIERGVSTDAKSNPFFKTNDDESNSSVFGRWGT
jgi:hypothetical protein